MTIFEEITLDTFVNHNVVKKYFILLSLLISLSCPAQNYTEHWSGTQFKAGSSLSFNFDYTGTKFNNYDYEDIVAIDPDFPKDLIDAELKYKNTFFKCSLKDKGFKDRNINVKIVPNDPDYIIVIHPYDFKRKGDFIGEMTIVDKAGNKVAYFENINGFGGTFGSLANLIGDAYKQHAEIMCKILGDAMREGKL